MRRIGKSNDGGYVICELPGLYDGFISGGVAGDVSFESQFCSLYSVACTAYDGTVTSLPTADPNIKFIRKNMSAFESPSTTNCIRDIKACSNVFLKMDIEGHEFRVLPGLVPYFDHVKQFVVEVHTPADMILHPTYFAGFDDLRNIPDVVDSLIEMISATHTLIHFHANNGCLTYVHNGERRPNVFECTFVRNDFMTEKLPHPGPLPGPHDMRNIPTKPDYVYRILPSSVSLA